MPPDKVEGKLCHFNDFKESHLTSLVYIVLILITMFFGYLY